LPYEDDDDDGEMRRGPNARIYVSRLLQWVENNYVGAISRVILNPSDFFDDSPHRITLFEPTYRWHFSKPDPYLHYFHTFSRQIRRLAAVDPRTRADAILTEMLTARVQHQLLQERGIVLDPESSGNHISAWITALNLHLRGTE
jgi:hypothetical protein